MTRQIISSSGAGLYLILYYGVAEKQMLGVSRIASERVLTLIE